MYQISKPWIWSLVFVLNMGASAGRCSICSCLNHCIESSRKYVEQDFWLNFRGKYSSSADGDHCSPQSPIKHLIPWSSISLFLPFSLAFLFSLIRSLHPHIMIAYLFPFIPQFIQQFASRLFLGYLLPKVWSEERIVMTIMPETSRKKKKMMMTDIHQNLLHLNLVLNCELFPTSLS